LAEWGIRCIIAPSFGAIFYGNCVRNGILPVVLSNDVVESLARTVEADPEKNRINVDLKTRSVVTSDRETYSFEIADGDREMLMEGLDAIAVTMKRDDEILAFQARDRLQRPWIYI
jgi:3-isopropylmalate/(R)-2-methylmalate dehydratase small subunit